MNNKVKIVNAQIVSGRYQNTVMVELEDGTITDVFKYYWDELSFSSYEFIGLTCDQACELFHRKDVAYLRS